MSGTGFWWILLANGLYGLLHSWLASHSAKRLAARLFGAQIVKRYYRLFFSLLAGPTFLPVLLLTATLPDQPIYSVLPPWRWVLYGLQGLAAAALLWAVLQTGVLDFTGLDAIFQPRERLTPARLVTGGFYRWVRHPLYLFGILFLWLSPTLTWNRMAFNIGVTMYLFIGSYFEERKLVADFGPEYERYRRTTPWLVPGLKINR